jgi:hypothetical protein
MGIDDESSSPGVVFRSCRRRYMPTSFGVRLFREPDAGNLPVRFDEREQETEPGQTGLRRARRKPRPIATGRLKPLRLFSTLLPIYKRGSQGHSSPSTGREDIFLPSRGAPSYSAITLIDLFRSRARAANCSLGPVLIASPQHCEYLVGSNRVPDHLVEGVRLQARRLLGGDRICET